MSNTPVVEADDFRHTMELQPNASDTIEIAFPEPAAGQFVSLKILDHTGWAMYNVSIWETSIYRMAFVTTQHKNQAGTLFAGYCGPLIELGVRGNVTTWFPSIEQQRCYLIGHCPWGANALTIRNQEENDFIYS